MVHLLLIHLFKYPGLTYLVACGAHWIVSELVKADVQQALPAGSRSQIQLVVTVVHQNKRWCILLKIIQWQDSLAVFRLYILLMRTHSFGSTRKANDKERKQFTNQCTLVYSSFWDLYWKVEVMFLLLDTYLKQWQTQIRDVLFVIATKTEHSRVWQQNHIRSNRTWDEIRRLFIYMPMMFWKPENIRPANILLKIKFFSS